MLTSHDVVAGYRLLLGREPENSAVIEHHIKCSTFATFRDGLLSSQEFQERLKSDSGLQNALAPATAVMNALRSRTPSRVPYRAGRLLAKSRAADGATGFLQRLGQSRAKKPSP